MPRVEFEPTTPAFEQAKTVHASDREATVIGISQSRTALKFMLPERNAHPIAESTDPKVTICQTIRPHIPEDSNFHPESMFVP
jgi:hypothetical protein